MQTGQYPDTPGHEDFSEDTYWPDGADASRHGGGLYKGLEAQTKKLFEVAVTVAFLSYLMNKLTVTSWATDLSC